MRVEIKGVSKRFKDRVILEDVNMVLEPNHIYGFIGPNGSGKTLILKMICGFYIPTTGEILINGENIIKKKEYPKDTGALIEKPSFLPDLTGYQNLQLLASIQNKVTKNQIEEIMDIVGLSEFKNQKYNTYSLGTKQKLGIAQAIMEDQQLIILDEPFNGLDEASAKKIRAYLLKEKEKGKLIILSTHIKEDVKRLADTLYMFENGKVKNIKQKSK